MIQWRIKFERTREFFAKMVNFKLTKDNQARVLEIDKGIKNKFRWEWLEKQVTLTWKIGKPTEQVTENIADFIAKCDMPGKAQCIYCKDFLSYGSRGYVAFVEHCSKQKHKEIVATWRWHSIYFPLFSFFSVLIPVLWAILYYS